MPRDSDKNNNSRGRRDRPGDGKGRAGGGKGGSKGRSGAARGPEKKFAKRGFAGKGDGDGERRPYAGKSEGAKSFGKKPYPAAESLMPASATAMTVRRAGTLATRRARVAIGHLLAVRHAVAMVKSARSSRAKIAVATSARTRRAATGRISIATTVRRAGGSQGRPGDRDDARPAGRFSDRKFGDRKPYTPREGGGEKRPYTPRGEGFRKDGDRPRGDRPYSARRARRPPRWRSAREKIRRGQEVLLARGAPDRGPRKDFGERPTTRRFQAVAEARGRLIARNAMRGRLAMARGISTSRALTSPLRQAARRSRRQRTSALLAFARRPSHRRSPEIRPSASAGSQGRPGVSQ